jgi:hypothetical protein
MRQIRQFWACVSNFLTGDHSDGNNYLTASARVRVRVKEFKIEYVATTVGTEFASTAPTALVSSVTVAANNSYLSACSQKYKYHGFILL